MNVREEKTNLDFLKETLDRNMDDQGTSSEASDGKNIILDPAGNVKSESLNSLSHVQLFSTPWTVVYQASPSMGFSRQEHWSGLPFPSPGDLPNPGIEPGSPAL